MNLAIEQKVYDFADTILRPLDRVHQEQRTTLASGDIERAVEQARTVVITLEPSTAIGASILTSVVRKLESKYLTTVPISTSLVDRTGHVPWFTHRKSELKFQFWRRYERYLQEAKNWSPQTIFRLDQLTDTILGELEDPKRIGPWDRRGMVVGQVQSGKTSNYTGLVCKAADAGYRIIVILAGIHNSLRSQTQLRIDEGVLGFDTQKNLEFNKSNARVGVGLLRGVDEPVAHALTSSSEQGDFRSVVAGSVNVSLASNDPVILVVKKNKSVLENLLSWISSSERAYTDPNSGAKVVPEIPLLLIDDEADYASINTKGQALNRQAEGLDEEDPSVINGLIRKILRSFEKSAYVAYTATPFANIFINEQAQGDQFGEDLFPRSFIINMKAPSNYVGPAHVFGLDAEAAIDAGLPIIRSTYDFEDWVPDKHKKDHQPGDCPRSLKNAVLSFILACAARMQRKHTSAHNSMLVHVTRFTAVQDLVAEQIEAYLYRAKRAIEFESEHSNHEIIRNLRQLWEDDYLLTSQAMGEQLVDWDRISAFLLPAVARIQVRRINGSAGDILDYWKNQNGLSVIAIGGEKLSRGLTLEGLTVSYYLRASRMYDTLMQMGRWFGYRDEYLDLCRLFTSPELIEWYKHITEASEELRDEFDAMTAVGATPADFGLKVRTHPHGLTITSVSKMRTGTKMPLSFSRSLSETVVFWRKEVPNATNMRALENLIGYLGAPKPRRGNRGNLLWEAVPTANVLAFLREYRNHPDSRLSNPQLLHDYIETSRSAGELQEWTIALISSQSKQAGTVFIADHEVGMTVRSSKDSTLEKYILPKRHLLNPKDEMLDLDDHETSMALELTNATREQQGKEPTLVPSGVFIRSTRPQSKGLMILYVLDPAEVGLESPVPGFVISFPQSSSGLAIEYAVNNIYLDQELGLI